MKHANGCSSPVAAGSMTRLWQNSLLAWVKSYVPSNTAASSLGLCENSEHHVSQFGEEGNSQGRKHLFGRLGIKCRFWRRLPARCNGPQPNHFQRARKRPALREVILHGDISLPERLARMPDALYDLLNGSLVDKVVEAHLVRVLKLKLVVVGEQPYQREGRYYPRRCVGILDELSLVSMPPRERNRLVLLSSPKGTSPSG
jgi:hypothetical protein